jgi:hypothetical protein
MRGDIAKVVFERPKGGRTWASKTPRPAAVLVDRACEQLDESSNCIRRRRQKMRNSNMGPLKHFLECRVGRPWNTVWSEVCDALDLRSALGREVRERIDWLVDRDCWIEGRTVMSHSCCGRPRKVRGLYVHPRSGLLRRAPEER